MAKGAKKLSIKVKGAGKSSAPKLTGADKTPKGQNRDYTKDALRNGSDDQYSFSFGNTGMTGES
jgi:hypothetical protein